MEIAGDVAETIAALSEAAIAGLLNRKDLTQSARKELQRTGIFHCRTSDKTEFGRDVFKVLKAAQE